MKAYLIEYENEFEKICGIKQLKEFTQYRIEVEEEKNKFQYNNFDNLTEEECLNILQIDGYNVQIFEIY